MLRIRIAAGLALACLLSLLAPGSSPRAIGGNIVISQVYGGGGNSGATLKNDFIELFNPGPTDVSLEGWSVQYGSSSGTTWTNRTNLSGTIPAGGYYLIQEAAGTGGTVNLPTPDAIGTIAMSATAGKIALVRLTTALTGACPVDASIVDFVGYGAANCSETAPAATLSNTTAALRAGNGCTDTDNNSADFSAQAPLPRNSSSPVTACTVSTPPTGTGLATPASVQNGDSSLLTVAVVSGANPPSTGLAVAADLTSIGGASTQPFFDDGTNGDAVAGDLVFSLNATVTGTVGVKSLTATVSDAQGRSSTATISVTIEPPVTPIYVLQGAGSSSPYAGQLVTTTGIVTARKYNGFFIQVPDGEGDGDVQTSDGIQVFTSSAPPLSAVVGNEVRIVGTLQEYIPSADPGSPPLTEITSLQALTVLSTGDAVPNPVVLQPSFTTTTGGFEQLERFEGMRVVADITAISPTDGTVNEPNATATSNGIFYAVLRGIPRPVREPGYDPTETLPPGAPCCVPAFDGNPERLRVDSDAQLTAPKIEIASGQTIDGLTGVLDYAYRSYMILPDPGTVYIPEGPAAAQPVADATPNQFTVASYNMERFFDTTNDPAYSEPVLTTVAFDRRLSKASLAIRDILRMPDVLGLVEIENIGVLEAIAARVNADAIADGQPDPQYVAYLEEGNDPGGIDVGFLVKSSRVNVVSVQQIGKNATYYNVESGTEDLLNDRPPLALRAAVRREPGVSVFPITVIVNHLRSLNGMTDEGAAGERVRDKRRLQAEFLANYIQALQAADPNERIISVGDYNAFQFNDGFVDVIGTITGMPTPFDQVVSASEDLVDPDLVNLGDALGTQAQYSYSFDGNAQAIDHVLVNRAAYKRLAGFQYAHLGADFPESFRSDGTRPERLSDHDAAVAYFEMPAAPIVVIPPMGR